MERRTTAQQLEEFRRRKAREMTIIKAKPSTPLPSMDNKLLTVPASPVTTESPTSIADTCKMDRCHEHRDQQACMPVWWTRLSTWMYNAVMPDHVLGNPANNGPSHSAENLSGPEENEETEDVNLADQSSSTVPVTTTQRIQLFLHSVYLWWILAWMCGWALAIRYGWGAVYFSLSVLLVIWKSLERSRRRKRGERSAYSVFNENCERIEGTLDAEQLQRTMFLGI